MHPNDKMLIQNTKNVLSEIFCIDKEGKGDYDSDKHMEVIMTNLPDIVKELEDKKAYYADQLQKINKALMGIKGGPVTLNDKVSAGTIKRKKRIQWSKEIMAIFDTHPEQSFSPLDIREVLTEKGLFLESTGNKNAIYTTISRLLNKGKINKVDDGLYQKREEH